jgi:hypothetical protein
VPYDLLLRARVRHRKRLERARWLLYLGISPPPNQPLAPLASVAGDSLIAVGAGTTLDFIADADIGFGLGCRLIITRLQ